jgi:hypothetical protein
VIEAAFFSLPSAEVERLASYADIPEDAYVDLLHCPSVVGSESWRHCSAVIRRVHLFPFAPHQSQRSRFSVSDAILSEHSKNGQPMSWCMLAPLGPKLHLGLKCT